LTCNFTHLELRLVHFPDTASTQARDINLNLGLTLVRNQKNQYQKLFDYSADAFLIIDGDKFVDCNNATLEMLQYESKEALFATHPSELSPEIQPDGRHSFEKANEMIAIALKKGSNRFNWIHTRKNGEDFPVEVLLTAIPDNDKTLIHVVWRDMSDRDRLQHELIQAQRIARTGSWIFDLQNNKLEWSNEIYRIFEVEPDQFEVSYESYLEAVHPEDRDIAVQVYNESLKENAQHYRSTHRLLFPDGRIKYIHESGETLFNAAGEAIFSRGTTQDVTERVEADKSLQESEAWFKAVTQQSTEGITVADPQGNYTFVNSAFCNMVGYSQQELLQMTVFDVKAPDQDPSSFEKSKTSKQGQSIQVLLQRKDSTEFIAEVIGKIIDISGVDHVLGTIRDITAQVQSEEALQISETQYRGLVDSIPDILYRTDMQGIITFISRSVYKLAGYTQEEVIGIKMAEDFYANPAERKFFLTKLMEKEFVDDFEIKFKRKDGSIWWGSTNAHLLKAPDGSAIGIEGIIRDITERKNAEKQLNYQATYDALTGLFNRYEFERCAVRLLSNKAKESDEHVLCFLDLDQFKVINDTCGHTAGDELLRQLGKVLRRAVRKNDTLARLGGDEFGILMEYCTLDEAHRVANALLKRVRDYQFVWEGQSFRLGVSIGLVGTNKNTPDYTELLKQADTACYMAKDLGRNRIHTYLPEDAELAQRHGEIQWVTRINQALEADRFCLYAQPIVPLDGSNDQHYELLIRMEGENGEIIPPGAFLPAAERYSLMGKLDAWVIENAFNLLASNPEFVEQTDFITINLSGQSLVNDDFLELITSQLQTSKVEASRICFEVTETVAISNLTAAITFITRLKKIGCRFALDDFGSGLSSFGYLKNLPVDYLKIDGMFVKDIVNDPIDYAMVRSINDIGQVMGMQTIAEFVEDSEIRGMLKAIGVNFVQGFGIGKPQPFIELLEPSNCFAISR